jgi:hypothetical protein
MEYFFRYDKSSFSLFQSKRAKYPVIPSEVIAENTDNVDLPPFRLFKKYSYTRIINSLIFSVNPPVQNLTVNLTLLRRRT